MDDKLYMILESNPNDPTDVSIHRVTADEYMAVWVENMKPIVESFMSMTTRIQEAFPQIKAAIEPFMDDDPKQIAHERSKADRRRKTRPGRYRWGG